MSKIVVVVGSLRAESYNRRFAQALTRLPAASGHEFVFADIAALPLYNQDDDGDQAPSVKALKELVRGADGVIFVTAEYNRSIPGVLKNAIDNASRPYGDSAWAGKPAGVIGVSIGAIGTALSQQHLRNVLAYLDMPTLGAPEAFIQWKDGLIGEDGTVGAQSAGFVGGWLEAFLALVDRHKG
ncbi:NADPH-dependent FMN reductase [Novosphingobium aerophilum]|uniref:NADPH-dependent FMN reductase n=1 Tax=Novosphingobium TaxID=165696 RepID=UPI0006C8D8C8|nr:MULTISPECIES: NAD(P)H-dependent oxidoreductase [unclassified Novosphingobium]KPH57586.1 NADPH-dependent FMN reductase [Novosphingobium sp. ST904]MPS67641.1 NADPH-dependent oxidoreductase [Novosphingobium sp.]TCM43182.1 chromate reductase [Novosphingobium sp. ST904]WRT93103.1 NAD(P)H-dependent oxidoreductase [Novosphingobium sp. RL4]